MNVCYRFASLCSRIYPNHAPSPLQHSYFSQYLVFMDAVHNTNRKGYTVLTLMVKDEFGRGCPVAYCISSTEDAATWGRFIREDESTDVTSF